MTGAAPHPHAEAADYDKLVEMFNRALIHTLRKHSVADSYLDLWVPDSDPVVGILNMIDSARFAGLETLSIKVSKKLLPADRIAEVERAASKVGKVQIETGPDGFLIHAAALSKDAGSERQREIKTTAKRDYWRPNAAHAEAKPVSVESLWNSGELIEFADVHPHFRPPLKAAAAALKLEVEAPPPADGAIQVTGQEGAVRLTFNVDRTSQIVRAAVHSGASSPAERAILDLFCRAASGLPIQEVADHLGLKILASLVDMDRGPPVPGVLLPSNSGKPFAVPGRLARRAYDAFRAATGTKIETNFYYPPPSAAWQALSAEERMGKVERIVRAFLQSEDMLQDDIAVHKVERNRYGFDVRVIVGFADRIATARKPQLMRQLEKLLRRDADPELELVAERAKDTSPLRRLS
jgi:hypothetical protein